MESGTADWSVNQTRLPKLWRQFVWKFIIIYKLGAVGGGGGGLCTDPRWGFASPGPSGTKEHFLIGDSDKQQNISLLLSACAAGVLS